MFRDRSKKTNPPQARTEPHVPPERTTDIPPHQRLDARVFFPREVGALTAWYWSKAGSVRYQGNAVVLHRSTGERIRLIDQEEYQEQERLRAKVGLDTGADREAAWRRLQQEGV